MSELERRILGCLLLDNDLFPMVVRLIDPEDFTEPRHRLIYVAVRYFCERNKPIDLVILADLLIRLGRFEQIGGDSMLSAIMESDFEPALISTYAMVLHDRGIEP